MIQLKACHQHERPKEIPGNAVTFVSSGIPIAIIGWHFIMDGVAQVWALLSDKISESKISFHKSVKLLIEYAFQVHSLRRMQLSVLRGYAAGHKWARSLGFSCEGIMRNYGPDGSDYWLFAKVKS